MKPGQRVSIVGESGSGKSAILDLLLRLHDPSAGGVAFDGRDARGLKSKELRSQVSILHDQGIWNGERTVRENLVYGLGREAADAELLDALRRSRAAFILDQEVFPEGLDSAWRSRTGASARPASACSRWPGLCWAIPVSCCSTAPSPV